MHWSLNHILWYGDKSVNVIYTYCEIGMVHNFHLSGDDLYHLFSEKVMSYIVDPRQRQRASKSKSFLIFHNWKSLTASREDEPKVSWRRTKHIVRVLWVFIPIPHIWLHKMALTLSTKPHSCSCCYRWTCRTAKKDASFTWRSLGHLLRFVPREKNFFY